MIDKITPKPHKEDKKLDALLVRAGIADGEKINEVDFGSRIHDKHFTPEEIASMKAGLAERGLWEPLA